jgi:peptide/nickel transport system permease protein
LTGFLLRRLLHLLTLALVATTLAYLLAATQLNPRSRYEGRNPPPPPHVVDSVLTALNLNDKTPVLARLSRWAGGVVRGDLGLSVDNQPVSGEIGRRIWVSVRLMLFGTLLGGVLAVAAGAYAAVRQYKTFDHTLTAFSFLVLSTPVVVLAVLLKNAGIGLNNLIGFTLLFTTGEVTPGLEAWNWPGVRDRLAHMVLPSLVFITIAIAVYGRYQRNAMLDVLGADFIRTARSKGLPRARALIRHGLRTALIPMATLFSYQFALVFIGATFTESIFSWHGMGQYFVHSVTNNDVNAVAGVALFVAMMLLAAGFVADVAYAALDPRVRSE